MKKITNLLYKDIILILKKPGILLLMFILPLFLLICVGFLMSFETKNLTLSVQEEYKSELENPIKGTFKDSEFQMELEYFSEKAIVEQIEISSSGVFLLREENRNPLIIVKGSDNANDIIVDLLLNELAPRKDNYKIEYKESDPSVIVSMVLSILIVMGTISIASGQLSREIEDKTIIILKKTGYRIPHVLIAKILAVTIVEIFFAVLLNIPLMNIVDINLSFAYLSAIFVVIVLSAFIGIIVASITQHRELQSLLIVFFYLPAVLIAQIQERIPGILIFILKINPLVSALELLRKSISGTVNLMNYSVPLIVAAILFPLSVYLFNRQLVKSISEG